MPAKQSFDIITECDLQEVDNAVNQAQKELDNRYDFRGVEFEIDFKRSDNTIVLTASDEYKLDAIWDVLSGKMIRREVPTKNLHRGEKEKAGGSMIRQVISLQMALSSDTAKQIVKFLKDKKLKKVQASIQQEQVRVVSPSRDELQNVMSILKAEDFDCELKFTNFRSQ
ncbi:MAG: YajQ family cyclic di-GMP-binding protein [Myxococcota bacterium]|jgi:hypothetical protein|nr:YajQ family cyclic di-GMP-binding protein [Myxococcota bacterium]